MSKAKLCPYCSREYKRKNYYDKHVILCQILHTKPATLKLESEERDDTPNIRELYELILEIGLRQTKIEEQLTHLTKWVETKRKKLSVIDWLNSNCKPEKTFEEWKNSIIIDRKRLETIFQYDYIEGISIILSEFIPLEEELAFPIKAFDQKDNALFIYTSSGWIFMKQDALETLLRCIDKAIMTEFVKWQNEIQSKLKNDFSIIFTDNVQKAIGGHYSHEQIHSKIKRKLFKHLKMNLRNVIQYEFTF